MSLISELVDGEVAWLAEQELATVRELTSIYQDVLLEIRAQMESLPDGSYTRNHLAAMEAQLDVLMAEMYNQHSTRLGEDISRVYRDSLYREKNTWVRLEETFGDARIADQFRAFLPGLNQQAVQALVQTANIPIRTFSAEVGQQVRTTLARSLVLGEGTRAAAARLKREGFKASPHRLQLITRMEMGRAQNEAKGEFIEQINEEFPELHFWQMIRERIDKSRKTRNHWFSFAIDGTVRDVTAGEFFEVHEAQLAAARQEYRAVTGRKTYDHGIIWPKFTKGRRGTSIPATFNGREVLQPFRPEWLEDAPGQFSNIKHPQGPVRTVEEMQEEAQQAKMPDMTEKNYNRAIDQVDQFAAKIATNPDPLNRESRRERRGEIQSGLASLPRIEVPGFETLIGTIQQKSERLLNVRPSDYMIQHQAIVGDLSLLKLAYGAVRADHTIWAMEVKINRPDGTIWGDVDLVTTKGGELHLFESKAGAHTGAGDLKRKTGPVYSHFANSENLSDILTSRFQKKNMIIYAPNALSNIDERWYKHIRPDFAAFDNISVINRLDQL